MGTLLACDAQIHAEEVHVATNDIDNFVGNLVDNTDNLYAETDENGDDSLDREEEEDSDETEDEEEELAEKLVDRVLKTSILPKADMETTTLAKNNEAQIRRRLNDELEDDKTLADYSDEELESMLHRVGGGTPQAAPARQLIVKAMKAMKATKVVTAMK